MRHIQSAQKLFSFLFPALVLFLPACGGTGAPFGETAAAQTDAGSCTGTTEATTLVAFDGGTFTMGDNTDRLTNDPEHSVTLSGFEIEDKEVTQSQFQAVCGSNPSNFRGDNLPVESVSWQEATDYCSAIGRRLPTEAEWEYASKNGGTAPIGAYATGDTTLPTCATVNAGIADGFEPCVGETTPVGSYPPSSVGLFNMAGNVSEWTSDWYDPDYYLDGQTDPTGPAAGTSRVIRGGSWGFFVVGFLTPSFRDHYTLEARESFIGFRCAG